MIQAWFLPPNGSNLKEILRARIYALQQVKCIKLEENHFGFIDPVQPLKGVHNFISGGGEVNGQQLVMHQHQVGR